MNTALTRRVVAFAALASLALTLHAHDNIKPAKGGAIAEASSGNRVELVREGAELAAYLSNHDGRLLAAAGSTVEVTLLVGTTRTQLVLAPTTGNRLAKASSVPAGAKAVVRFSVAGQAAEQVRLTLK